MLTHEERAAFFKMLADYKRNWITTSEVLKAVESIVRAARAQELRELAAELKTSDHTSNLVSMFELLDRANEIENS